MRASRSSLLGSVMGIHCGGIFRATLGFYRRFSEPFFLLSAHPFFIMSDNRFLPSGVRRPPLFLLRVTGLGAALLFAVALGSFADPSGPKASGRWLEYNEVARTEWGIVTHSWNPTVSLTFISTRVRGVSRPQDSVRAVLATQAVG